MNFDSDFDFDFGFDFNVELRTWNFELLSSNPKPRF